MLTFLFAPLHEAVHRTAFRSRRLNDAVAWIAGLVLLLPPNWFRAFHFAHHRYTQIEGRDPELELKRVETWPDYLIHLSGWRSWKGAVELLLRNASGRAAAPFVPKHLEPRLVREARIMLAVYAAIAALSVAFALGCGASSTGCCRRSSGSRSSGPISSPSTPGCRSSRISGRTRARR